MYTRKRDKNVTSTVVEACVVVAVRGRVGEVRVAADEPEAVDLAPGVLARRKTIFQ